jgi:hypothetical protein
MRQAISDLPFAADAFSAYEPLMKVCIGDFTANIVCAY